MSSELGVAVCATKLDLIEIECSFKSAMKSKIHKNMINFVKKFVLTSIGVSLLSAIRLPPILGIKTPQTNTEN